MYDNCNRPKVGCSTVFLSRTLLDWLTWTQLVPWWYHNSLGYRSCTKYRTCWWDRVCSKSSRRYKFVKKILVIGTSIAWHNRAHRLWAQNLLHIWGMGIAMLSTHWRLFFVRHSKLFHTKQSSCTHSSIQDNPHPFESGNCQCYFSRKIHWPIWTHQDILYTLHFRQWCNLDLKHNTHFANRIQTGIWYIRCCSGPDSLVQRNYTSCFGGRSSWRRLCIGLDDCRLCSLIQWRCKWIKCSERWDCNRFDIWSTNLMSLARDTLEAGYNTDCL